LKEKKDCRKTVVKQIETANFLPHGNGVVEQYERRDFVAIQASLMNFITFDHYQWVASLREVS
jgi:hypothetical protein